VLEGKGRLGSFFFTLPLEKRLRRKLLLDSPGPTCSLERCDSGRQQDQPQDNANSRLLKLMRDPGWPRDGQNA